MATLTASAMPVPTRPATPPSPHLTLNTISVPGKPSRIPNKHIPDCSPGPAPGLPSPPQSPAGSISDEFESAASLLHPPNRFQQLPSLPSVYALSAESLSAALEHAATQPLPDASVVFPWLHGLTYDNQMQLSFFRGVSKNPVPDIPACLRGITIVKTGGNLSYAKLKGAVCPEELLLPVDKCADGHAQHCKGGPCFIDIDPLRGFSVRNFKIQCCKLATVSDIVVYGDDDTPRQEVEDLARLMSKAQSTWSAKVGRDVRKFNTFVLTDSFEHIETHHPALVACSAAGLLSPHMMDFPNQERLEMAELSRASEICHNVYLGQTPEYLSNDEKPDVRPEYDVLIEASDYTTTPDKETLDEVESILRQKKRGCSVAHITFPASGSFFARGNVEGEVDALLNMCHWMHSLANGTKDERGRYKPGKHPRKLLIHCGDGYTESSFLGLCYYMFSECVPARDAWIQLHRDRKRNFFAYPADKQFLENIERRIMWQSPNPNKQMPKLGIPTWAKHLDGSLPSRILPYLYLGNLNHATNPGVLRQLGITHVLSVGEQITWQQDPATVDEESKFWPKEHFLYIDKVQDNGVDPLTREFGRCLDFIRDARDNGGATLVHCRVGVSRSATICIAEVMESLNLSLPRAYCFVRARRLNVIIQPHLRFTYELLQWEEDLCRKRNMPVRREFEWATIAREIAIMNKPYCRE